MTNNASWPSAALRAVALSTLALSLPLTHGCDGDAHGLTWGVSFANEDDRRAARLVEATIRESTCDGAVRYAVQFEVVDGRATTRPASLEAGHYCLTGRARGADCAWFVRGQLEIDLPSDQGPQIVVLDERIMEAECPADECTDGRCTGETPDGGMDSAADVGADTAPPTDAAMDTFVPDTRPADTAMDTATSDTATPDTSATCPGGCGEATCTAGTCACPGSLTRVSSEGSFICTDTSRDADACGSARSSCNDDEFCDMGSCVCRPGLDRIAGGACVDFGTNPMHCGGEGNACAIGSMIVCRRTCEDACNPLQTNCSNACIPDADLDTNPFHCGFCGNACNNDELCVAGACENYRPAVNLATGSACTSCPCPCPGGSRCCTHAGSAVCVDADSCP